MATKYVTLKDSNGDTLYPQAVATNLAPGSITSDEIDWSGTVTSTTVTCSNASVTFSSGYDTITIRKFGRLCIASFSLRFTSDHSFANFGNLDIATFPSGYRPSATTSWETMLARNSSQNASVPHMVFRVDANGVFRLQNGLSGAAICSVFDGTIAYLT